jgi:putative hemolysin
MGMKNKLIFLIPVILVLGVLAVFKLWFSEDSWICKDGQWVKHGNPSSPMPAKPCIKNGEIVSAQEIESGESIANPASTNCLEKGGKLSFIEETAGTLGICQFSDGTECEEWKFFRNECQMGQQTKADTTHPYTGLISRNGNNFTFKSDTGVEYNLEVSEALRPRLLSEMSSRQTVTILASENPPLSKTLALKGFQDK